MNLKRQLLKIKENWLLLLIVVILLLAFNFFNTDFTALQDFTITEESIARGFSPSSIIVDSGFAPKAEDRKITKTSSLFMEVKRGTFREAESRLKDIAKSSDSFLLNENVREEGEKRSFLTGDYQIKVATDKYDSVINQLKDIGEITSFSENSQDITKRNLNLETELSAERERLNRYQNMFREAESISDKITLNDRIFNQERTVKFLEDALRDINNKVEFSTIFVRITEKQSEFADTSLVKLSDLIKSLVLSINSLLKLILVLIPYAIAIYVIYLIARRGKR